MSKKEFDFKTLYTDLKREYSDLESVDDKTIDCIHQDILKVKKKERTDGYLMAVLGASLTIILYPFIIVKIFRALEKTAQLSEKVIKLISENNIDTFNFAFGFGGIAILMYLFLLPSFRIFSKFFPAKTLFEDINKNQSNYYISTFLGIYVVIGFSCFLIILNGFTISDFVANNLKYYLLVPISLITFFLTMFFIVVILILLFKRYFKGKYDYSNNSRIEISVNLLKIVDKIKDVKNGDFLSQAILNFITDKLDRVKNLIEAYPTNITEFKYDNNLTIDFKKAANEIEVLISYLIENHDNKIEEFRIKIINYANLILKGDLKELPKSNEIAEKEKIKKVKVYHYILFGLYLTLPILVIIILNLGFHLTLDDYSKSLIKILYIIWAFIGIFSNPFILNKENKDLMKELIKTLVGKG